MVVKAAALCPGMSVLEPSAGTGNIAVLARLLGADVDTNEIDPRRRELLVLQGFEPTALDAERLDNLLPLEKTYHAIVMNPPFEKGDCLAVHIHAVETGLSSDSAMNWRVSALDRFVLVSNSDAHSPCFRGNAGLFADIDKLPVSPILVQNTVRVIPSPHAIKRRALHQQEVHQAVVVVVESSQPAPLGFEDVVLLQRSSADVLECDARRVTDVDKLRDGDT